MRKHATRSCSLLLTLALLAFGATPSRAAPSADAALRKQARTRFLEGKKRFALRQFRTALASFKKAYELLPLSGFLFNIGQCYRFLGDCKTAIFYYSGFVRENPGTPDAKFVATLVTRCKGRLAASRAQQAKGCERDHPSDKKQGLCIQPQRPELGARDVAPPVHRS